MNSKPRRRAWKALDLQRLHFYASQGLPAAEVARRIGRSTRATQRMGMILGISFGARGRASGISTAEHRMLLRRWSVRVASRFRQRDEHIRDIATS